MKKAGIIIFLVANIYISWYYIKDIVKYFNNAYNYDGMRYLIPIVIVDIIFILSLIMLYFSFGFSKYFFGFIAIMLLHNVAMGMGIERIPFIGLFSAVIVILYIYYIN